MSKYDRLNALLVGCGRIAAGYNRSSNDKIVLTHAMAYQRHPRFSLVACVEPDEELRAQFMSEWGVERGYSTLDAALAAERNIDVASVCSPTTTHAQMLTRLLSAPLRAVFAEKPLGGDAAVAAHIVESYRTANRLLVVAYPRRWDDEVVRLRSEIRAQKWGKLRAAVAVYGRGIVNNGSHHIDLLGFLMDESLEIVAVTGSRFDGIEGDPTIDGVLRFASGSLVHLVGADGRDHSCFELTLVFERGVVSFEERGLFVRRRPVRMSDDFAEVRIVGDGERRPTGYGEALTHALDDIVSAIEHGTIPVSTGETALASIRLADHLKARGATFRAA